MAHKALHIGGRVLAGLASIAAAGAIVGAAVLMPAPSDAAPADVSGLAVTPQPIDQQRVCAGPLLRLGDANGQGATTVTSFGAPSVIASSGATSAALDDIDVVVADGGSSSSVITAPPLAADAAPLAAVQAQLAAEADQSGLAVASCDESAAVSWLVAGATDTGRTTLLLLENPSGVESIVDVALFGTEGRVDAPGLTDLVVPPASQRVLSLAGFAPGAAALAVQVESRGGLIVPTLQQSIVRGLEPGGVELTGATGAPSETQVVPGVRITTAQAAAERSQLGGSTDVATAVRVYVPGDEDAEISIGASSDTPGVAGVTVDATATAGSVVDIPVVGLGDGTYTVTVQSSVPVVAAVRAATVAAPDPNAPVLDADVSFEIVGDAGDVDVVAGQRIDFAWFVSAPTLDGTVSFATADAPAPRLTLTAAAGAAADVVLTDEQGERRELSVSAGSTASVDLTGARVYRLDGATGLTGAVSYAADGQLSATVLRPVNPLASTITVYR
ncbi:DUF5719 family protein [Herbiconiux sp. L3-i23]|uniref:DUF5719 family protein n=1 Tax=Herbiconiux sp. L3-i23 TaxID=2905871 RepID=UPI00206EC951|nr:DUF5719 family protein [Herbiconiux sp. L3-i23]BDI21677.1 hypothetical protein L3i23_04530 [Herbiconiux sp. L3-i23]